MDEIRHYQTGALSEKKCLLISKALKFYAASASPTGPDEIEHATELSDMFGDPEGNLIPADKDD